MRKLTLLLAVIGLAGSLWAADPDVGTWKLNVSQSKSNQPLPKESTLVVKVVGDQKELTFTGTEANGSSFSGKYMIPLAGGIGKSVTPTPAGDANRTSVTTVVNPNNFYLTSLKDGKQVELQHVVISQDGKTKHQTIKGVDSQGKLLNAVQVWDKQ
jgi:hypothetical protein